MKAGKSSVTAAILPRLSTNVRATANMSSLGGDAADQLDQLHQRHRIHEVHADEVLGPVGGSEARRVIEIDDVLEARIVPVFSFGQSSAKILRLTPSSSVAASMTRSQSPKASKLGA